MSASRIPPSLIGTASPILASTYTHDQLNSLFMSAGFPGDPPEGSKVAKCQGWLRRANNECPDPLPMFGRLIAELMDTDVKPASSLWGTPAEPVEDPREPIRAALGRESLSYQRGGLILGGALTGPSRSLSERLAKEGVSALEVEFRRASAQVEADPPAAVTAACAILETVCKT